MTSRADEPPREPEGPGFTDAVTYAWGDADAERFGLARVGLSAAPSGEGAQASGLAVLFADREPVAVRTAGGLPHADPASWDAVGAAGLETQEHAPLASWDVRFTSDDGASGWALRFEALSPPATTAPDHPVALTGGLQGYEQLCRVSGVVTVAGQPQAVDCLGQRGHSWGTPDWDRIELTRSVSLWLHEDLALSLAAVRPHKAKSHADEAIGASLFTALDEDGTVAAVTLDEARLSTTTDAEGRQRRAGVEVFLDDEDPGQRAAGAAICGTSLELGRLRLDCAFFAWRMDGHTGVGRYDVLRRSR